MQLDIFEVIQYRMHCILYSVYLYMWIFDWWSFYAIWTRFKM